MSQSAPLPAWLSCGYLLLFAVLPWSVERSFGAGQLDVPAEPLMGVLGAGIGWQIWKDPRSFFDLFKSGWLLPLSAGWLVGSAISAGSSTMPLVSWKYWAVEAAHWWVFAVGLTMWPMQWKRLVWVFTGSVSGLVCYTLVHHAQYHFRADQALLSPMPFFQEHTVYAAMLAMCLCGLLFLFWRASPFTRLLLIGACCLFLVGIALCYCRAAWGSLLLAGFLGLIILTGQVHWRKWIVVGTLLLTGGLFFRENFFEAAKTRTSRDVSTLERFNRYACAARMLAERPMTGFGPGTFQFQYMPFQRREEMTRISVGLPVYTHNPDTYGRGGSTHSEYWQALAETGWPGFALWLAWAATALYLCIRSLRAGYLKGQTDGEAWIYLSILLSLTTFFAHGLVNNLLHDTCIAAWVWGQLGVLNAYSERRNTGSGVAPG